MVDYATAIKRPYTDLKSLVIGFIVSIVPLVNLLNTGFALVSAKNTMNGKAEVADWMSQIVEIVKKSLGVLIIGFVYMLIPLIIIFVGAGSIITTIIASAAGGMTQQQMMAALTTGGPIMAVGGLLAVIAVYILPSAMMAYISTGFGSAFSVGTVFKKAFKIKYLIAWLISLVIGFVYVLVGAILIAIPVLGWIILSGLTSYCLSITMYTIFAETYKEL